MQGHFRELCPRSRIPAVAREFGIGECSARDWVPTKGKLGKMSHSRRHFVAKNNKQLILNWKRLWLTGCMKQRQSGYIISDHGDQDGNADYSKSSGKKTGFNIVP